jgi:hypothetical protein
MVSSTKQTTISAAVKNVAPTRNLYPSRRSTPFSSTISDSCWSGESSTKSLSDKYTDSDTEAVEDIELGSSEDASLVEKDLDPCLDSEAEEILNDIAQFRMEGPAKPNHTKHTTKLWKREGEFWER